MKLPVIDNLNHPLCAIYTVFALSNKTKSCLLQNCFIVWLLLHQRALRVINQYAEEGAFESVCVAIVYFATSAS